MLDEPSIGLHPRDNLKLLKTLEHLRDLGNTVLVVEHDEETIRRADHVIDLGPGAGAHGGLIVAQGTPEQIAASAESLTGRYMCGELAIPVPLERRPSNGKALAVLGARANNLKNSMSAFRWVSLLLSRVFQARASRRLWMTFCIAVSLASFIAVCRSPAHIARSLASNTSTDHRDRSIADWTHAAFEPGDLHWRVHADPRAVCYDARVARARL